MDLKKTLELSIARAEKEIKHCKEELKGKRKISNLHRNLFHYIAGTIAGIAGIDEDPFFYFDDEDIEYQRLREVAIEISEERARNYDSICRKYLDIEDIVRIFQRNAEGGSLIASYSLSKLQNRGLIDGAHVLNYATSLVREGSSDGFEAYIKISKEMYSSDFRKDSVQREIKVFKDYIRLCQKKLDALTPHSS